MKVKLKDIAERSGVSINTVSMAIRGMPGIKSETKEIILRVANELGYFDQKSKIETHNIALISTSENLRDSYFYMSFQQRIMQQVHQHKYNIMVYDSVSCKNNLTDLRRMFEINSVSGIILLGDMDENIVRNIVHTEIPSICIGARYYNIDTYTLIEDNFAGAHMAVQHLLENGYRKIGFVGRPTHSIGFLERYSGFIAAMKYFLLPYDERWSITDMKVEEEYDFTAVAGRIQELPELPDAFVCANDNIGIIVAKALHSLHLHVPKDVALIGFDNSVMGKMAIPSLTSIDVQCAVQSEVSVKVLIDFINGCVPEVQRVSIPVVLVEGDSVVKKSEYQL
jgi:LacI family transcriptional regulator